MSTDETDVILWWIHDKHMVQYHGPFPSEAYARQVWRNISGEGRYECVIVKVTGQEIKVL